MSWDARVLTLFPEMFPGPLGDSLAGKALAAGLWSLRTIDIRDFATDRHATVDDTPFGGGPGMVMRADVVERLGGYRQVDWPEDYDLVLRAWEAGGALGKVPEVLLRWREGADRLSRNDERYGHEAFLACKMHYLTRTLLGDAREAVIWGAGPVGKSVSRALGRLGVRVRAFVDLDPRKIGQEIHDAPVLDTDSGLATRGVLHLAAVGQQGARERIVSLLEAAGFTALEDFVAIA